MQAGECLGIIGESGSGKSTLGRLILGIEKPDRGTIRFEGKRVEDRKSRRGMISAVFQDYTSSINPFYTVEQALMEPMKLQGNSARDTQNKIELLLWQVGLDPSYRKKYPHELSGRSPKGMYCKGRQHGAEMHFVG
ncbi:ATP-binding cassette domain-containing protein [Paenibacillus sp. P26]|nr:ATP-binding cassette domain-containing protein [Paenibacillus sp. P26]